jgi:hypothetical protein
MECLNLSILKAVKIPYITLFLVHIRIFTLNLIKIYLRFIFDSLGRSNIGGNSIPGIILLEAGN